MSNFQHPGGASASLPAAAVPIPATVLRIRRQLYWQAVFGLLRAAIGLAVILLVVQSMASVAAVVAAGILGAGVVLAVVSIVLARQVQWRRPSTRTAIIWLEALVGAIYGPLTLQAIVGLFSGGRLVAVTYNAVGLLIAIAVLWRIAGTDARAWFRDA